VQPFAHAAYLLGLHGSPDDQNVLEARLRRWQEEWGNLMAEADEQHQGRIERELIWALSHGNSWKCPPERMRELKIGCVTQMCKQSNRYSECPPRKFIFFALENDPHYYFRKPLSNNSR
jgi:hypothetical protein